MMLKILFLMLKMYTVAFIDTSLLWETLTLKNKYANVINKTHNFIRQINRWTLRQLFCITRLCLNMQTSQYLI